MPVKQHSLFPVKDSLYEATSTLKESLPITDENELHALLMMYHNTLLEALKVDEVTHSNQESTLENQTV
jgi:hypothetical protein